MLLRNLLLGGTSPRALFAPEGVDGGGGSVAPVNVQTDTGPLSVRAAADAFRARADKGAAAVAETPDATETPTQQPRVNGRFASAAAPDESTPAGEDAAAETPSGEEAGTEAETPIDPPHSWTKAEKERFASLPRETQAYLAERESARDADLNRRQSEAAEKSKALEAKEHAAEQARQQYETAAQNALQVLQQQQASEFSDIKTHNDVQRLADEDPFRFAKWQARQMQIEAQDREVRAINQQRQDERSKTFKSWSEEQDAKFTKQFPEFADKEKAGKVREGITAYLTQEVGVPADKLPMLWETDLFRDAMWQRVTYDAYRFHAAQAKAKQAVPVKLPPVQRPGVAPSKGEASQANIAALTAKLDNATSSRAQIAAAAALRAAKRSLPH
jgi:hypothetical protein